MTPTLLAQRPKPGKYYEEHGLVAVVRKTGSIYFEQRYTYKGSRHTVGLGSYPELSLADAREQAIANLRLVRAGIDPIAEKRRPATPTLAEACAIVVKERKARWSQPATAVAAMRAIEKYVVPELGDRLVSDISTEDIRSLLEPIMKAAPSMAKRLRGVLNIVMRWAIGSGFRPDNPVTSQLSRAVFRAARSKRHHPALPHSDVGAALAVIRSSGAWVSVRLAIEFLILTAARSGEVRGAVWDEIHFGDALWTIPAGRMKTGEEHLVPLAPQSISVLRSALALGDGTGLVFPSRSGGEMRGTYFSKLFHRLGIACVPHGMRSSFRDWCGETGVDRQARARRIRTRSCATGSSAIAGGRSSRWWRRIVIPSHPRHGRCGGPIR